MVKTEARAEKCYPRSAGPTLTEYRVEQTLNAKLHSQVWLLKTHPLVSVLSLTSLSFSSISSVALTTVLGVGKRIPICRGAENGQCLVHVHRTT